MASATEASAPRAPGTKPARRGGKLRAAMTPMIDVTFLLLLFFLLTFTFRQAEGQLPGVLPGDTVVPPPNPRPIRPDELQVSVLPMGEHRSGVLYEVEGVPHAIRTPEELGRTLQAFAHVGGRDRPVRIGVRGDVHWRWAVEAYNQAIRAKFTAISLDGML